MFPSPSWLRPYVASVVRRVTPVLALVSLLIPGPVAAAEARPSDIRVLLVTGIDYPGHKWRETTPVLVAALTNDARLCVDVLEDPYRLDTTDLSPYRAVFLHFMNWEKPDPNDQAKENLRSFVERGGGMVMIHFACGAFQDWPEFRNLAGRIYDRTNTHDPRGPFTVEITKTNHAITHGMASFGVDDELYICLTGEKPIDVLATARSKVTQRDHPMAFVHSYGKGRVFQTPLGHDVKALRSGRTLELIRGGTLWAAGLENESSANANRAEIERAFTLPPGFSMQLIAAEPDIANPMSIAVDELGTLWVTEAHTYRWGTNGSPFQPPTNPIKRIELGPDGRAATTMVAAEGFPEPVIGVCAREGQLYATCLNELFVMDIASDGKLVHRKLLVKDAAVPWNPFGMYRVQVGPDDKLWLCIADHPGSEPVTLTGSDGLVVRLAGKSGGMVRCHLDGSGLEIIAQGFRAPYAFDIDPWGHVWHISNGEGSPNLYVHVIPGLDYGYASRSASYAWLAGQEPLSPPVRDMGAGANTAALHYYSSQFPREFWGNILIANWGSHGANPANRDLRRFGRAKDGHDRAGTSDAELSEVETFLTSTDPMFRPTGLALAPDGGLYLIDWHGRDDENDKTGRIFKITYTEPRRSRREEALIKSEVKAGPMTSAALAQEITHLGHPNHFIRETAQRALARSGERALEPLGRVAENGEPLAAAGAIWTLSRIHSEAAGQTLAHALKHSDSRVRAHALRQLRQAAGQTLAGDTGPRPHPLMAPANLAKLAAPLLQDSDAEVRVEAALAQNSSGGVTRGLLAALAAAPDGRLLYQIGMQLGRRGDAGSVLALVHSANSVRQRAGLTALDTARYEQTPLVANVKKLEPRAMEELPPADFSQKLAWLQRHEPELLAAVFARLEDADPSLSTPAEMLAALTVLELSPPKKFPVKFLVAGLENSDPRVQEAALRVVRQSSAGEKTLLALTLKILHSTKTPDTRLEAIYALGSFGNAVSVNEWLGSVQSSEKDVVAATLRSMRQVEQAPELAEALWQAAPALAMREPDLAEDLLLTLRELGVQAGQCERLPIKVNAPKTKSELAALVMARVPNGSATLGRLSFHSGRAGCAKCHSLKPGESPFGPSLADIGTASQPEYLVESILEPNQIIKTGFQSETIETSDGQVWSGLVEAIGGQLLVKTSPDEQWTVPLDQVKSRVVSLVSPMPEGLESAMSQAELADLVAWLQSLRILHPSQLGASAAIALTAAPAAETIVKISSPGVQFLTRPRATLALPGPLGEPKTELEWQYISLINSLRDRHRIAAVSNQTFRSEALILPGDRDPADVVARRTAALLENLKRSSAAPRVVVWEEPLRALQAEVAEVPIVSAEKRYDLYERICALRRKIAFANPLLEFQELLFVKRHRSLFNHMCDQYYGMTARPGGGLHVLSDPFGSNPTVRDVLAHSVVAEGRLKGQKLTGGPNKPYALRFDGEGNLSGDDTEGGSFLSPELSYDGKTILFAYVECSGDRHHRHHTDPTQGHWAEGRCYHIFKVNADGSDLRQITDGTWNDFSPCWLPNGRIAFISERRGGYLRCGRTCPTYTLYDMAEDGRDINCLSVHETNEWDPSVTPDGRIIWTRWDYVDRHGCTAHMPWITTLDGRDPRPVHGNYAPRPGRPDMELNVRAIPGSRKYVATAAPHHGQAFGSLIMIDPDVPDDDLMAPVKRVTPEIAFPESQGGAEAYGTAWPLSEDYFLCAYDARMPSGNHVGQHMKQYPNNYGLYLVDSFGNKELLYRDPEISCQSPIPLRSRIKPPLPVLAAASSRINPAAQPADNVQPEEAIVSVLNVYESQLPWPDGTRIKALRVLQVLPMTVPSGAPPHETGLRVTGAGDSVVPVRHVLGTVPVEEDGSAHLVVPANREIFFQALDERGLAVQSMRSATALRAGEHLMCQGCHASPARTPPATAAVPLAMRRPASRLQPEAEGSNPFSYPRLVQPVLDRNCVSCHEKNAGKALNLAREPLHKKWYASYQSLTPIFGFYDYGDDYRTRPGRFGARASKLFKILEAGHYDVKLSDDDLRRLALWLDCSSMFYGVYEKEGGEAQLRGEIARPTLE